MRPNLWLVCVYNYNINIRITHQKFIYNNMMNEFRNPTFYMPMYCQEKNKSGQFFKNSINIILRKRNLPKIT